MRYPPTKFWILWVRIAAAWKPNDRCSSIRQSGSSGSRGGGRRVCRSSSSPPTAAAPPPSRRAAPSAASASSFVDFTSQQEWENFYQRGGGGDVSGGDTTEWHSSVPLETIASYVPPGGNCLMVGCGTSRLPDAVLSSWSAGRNGGRDDPPPGGRIALLDSSPACIAQLRERYRREPRVHCVRGDAMDLSNVLLGSDSNTFYDTIVDKGWMDVLLCSDGWDFHVRKWLEQAVAVLLHNGGDSGGRRRCRYYVLVSYRLPVSTQETLVEIVRGRPQWGRRMTWQFHLPPGSNDRVSVSVASICDDGDDGRMKKGKYVLLNDAMR